MYDARVYVCECGWEADVVHMFKIVNVCVCVGPFRVFLWI